MTPADSAYIACTPALKDKFQPLSLVVDIFYDTFTIHNGTCAIRKLFARTFFFSTPYMRPIGVSHCNFNAFRIPTLIASIIRMK